MDDLLVDGLRQLLAGCCSPAAVRAAEAGEPVGPLWQQLEASGYADAMLPEDAGGAGLPLAAVFPLLELCGRHALPVPLADTILARGVLARAGLRPPAGSIALAAGHPAAAGALRCGAVPLGRVADSVLLASGAQWLLLPVRQARSEAAVFPLDAALEWGATAVAGAPRIPAPLGMEVLQAASLAAQTAGALRWVFDRTLQYANERQQFGRPIGKFQAIQHQLSVMAEHVFAARMAAQLGCAGAGALPQRLRVAVAKARTSEAALEVASLSHSIHGAIGFTAEFDLQLYTRRLHAWRQAGGAESYWHRVLGELLVDGSTGLALDLVRAATDPETTET